MPIHPNTFRAELARQLGIVDKEEIKDCFSRFTGWRVARREQASWMGRTGRGPRLNQGSLFPPHVSANFIDVYGWEKPKWFSNNDEKEDYSYRRNNSFNYVKVRIQVYINYIAPLFSFHT